MNSKFPTEMIEKVQELFKRFGYPKYPENLSVSKFGDISRYLGRNPSNEQLKKIILTHKRRKKRLGGKKKEMNEMTPTDFILLYRKLNDTIDGDEMEAAFRCYEPAVVFEKFSEKLGYTSKEFENLMWRYYPDYEDSGSDVSGYVEEF